MPITKGKKAEMITELEGLLKGTQSMVFVNFHKLSVADTTNLRRGLRGNGVGYKVAKKTLVKRVLDSIAPTGTMPSLDGELAIAYANDLLAPAREVYNFQKEHKDSVQIIGGVFEGKYMSKEEMLSIATIPGMQTLRAQFVNLINSPIQRFAVVLNAIAEKKV